MPEFLAPGVYIQETSFRSKSIEGLSTTTTGFVGPTSYGPITQGVDILTSLNDFVHTYGDGQRLQFKDEPPTHNYLWQAARAFFTEGGKRLYVSRIFKPLSGSYPPTSFVDADAPSPYVDGHARASIPATGGPSSIQFMARFPGVAGNSSVTLTLRMRQNILSAEPGTVASPETRPRPRVNSLLDNDIVWIGTPTDALNGISSLSGSLESLYIAGYDVDKQTWSFTNATGTLTLDQLDPVGEVVRVVTLSITATPTNSTNAPLVWSEIPLDPRHTQSGSNDSLFDRFALDLGNMALERTLPIVIRPADNSNITTGLDVLNALFTTKSDLPEQLSNFASKDTKLRARSTDAARSITFTLKGGNDGLRPTPAEYEGIADDDKNYKTGLKVFEDLDGISIVAAPGSTFGYEDRVDAKADVDTIIDHLIVHATSMRYRIAVLDSGNGQSISQVRALRAKFDSTYAALYYPWILIDDPVTGKQITQPPSGFVAGIYARNDVNRAVYKAPANEVVNLAIGFEQLLNKNQQEVLNPEGINCFRFFPDRGFRLWGARTISSDSEWKYVDVRRYFAYLEHSIDKGTQWAVFEPNGPALWGNVRRSIELFLLNEWRSGALLGTSPEQAYFVRCDLSTMTQNDLDNGRLVCLIGVAPVMPAEFVIFYIGQSTASSR